jgi:hypothetical protein
MDAAALRVPFEALSRTFRLRQKQVRHVWRRARGRRGFSTGRGGGARARSRDPATERPFD